MSKIAYEQVFNGSLDLATVGSYDATKINPTTLLSQFDLGSGERDKYAGPLPIATARPAESPLPAGAQFVHPVQWAPDLFWVFLGDAATASGTRRVTLYDYIPSTGTYTFKGAITCTLPVATNHTMRGIRSVYAKYTTGSAAVSGTAVTGSGTAWNTTRQCVGSRIGFGSTDPTQIVTWYQISAVGSDTSITLTATGGTIADGPYVIEDLQVVMTTSNATVTNGGVFLIKGLRYELFNNPATVIPAATTVDRIRACYWLKDAATVTNTVAGGCAIDETHDWTTRFIYVCDGAATTLKLFKYNIRAALTVASGAATLSGGDLVITGNNTVVGNILQINNGRVGTLGHGPGSGVACLYLLTTTRVLRIPLTNIVAASTTIVADTMAEVPPGGTNTNAILSTFGGFDISGTLDRLVIVGAASAGTVYITQYRTDGGQYELRGASHSYQLSSGLADTDSPPYPHFTATIAPQIWIESGIMFWVDPSATANLNILHAYPFGADLNFVSSTNQRLILPKITLGAAASKLYRAYVNALQLYGDAAYGTAPDAVRVVYRTSGIDDDSGSWTVLDSRNDLSGVGVPAAIQFALEFRTTGVYVPARVLSLALLYESNDALPSQYQWNFGDFNSTNGTFAFIQSALFSAALTTHTINIYRADTNALVLTQASSGTTNGTFEYWNGSAWVSGLGTDVVGTRRRFVPTASLPSGIDLYATITVA